MEQLILRDYHRDALRLLRRHPVAAVPRAVCHGAALRHMETHGLVLKAGIPGYWSITDEGRDVNLKKEQSRADTQFVARTPSPNVGKSLRQAFAAIDGLFPGSRLFGQRVRQSALETLIGRSRAQKFVYFAYPLGFPLKHIAWAVAPDKPLWTDHNVSVTRGQVLGLPALRRKSIVDPLRASEKALRAQLLGEGVSDWEIEEYFAVRAREAAL